MPERNGHAGSQLGDHTARAVAIVGLAGVGLIHLLDAHDTFLATPYKGWLYVALIAGSAATAMRLMWKADAIAWTAATLLPLGAFAAFVYSRTVGLPGGADDIGNWWEPLGLASLFVEGLLIALSTSVLYDGVRLALPARSPVASRSQMVEGGAR
jgi:hypothetical protein